MAQTKIPTKQLPVATSVGTPGSDTQIPSEQAVREAIAATPNAVTTVLVLYANCQ
jgi:hypothetical protein